MSQILKGPTKSSQDLQLQAAEKGFRLSSRQFLELSGAVAVFAGISTMLPSSPFTLRESEAQTTAASTGITEDVWFPTSCWMCSQACALMVHRVNGVVVKVEGNVNAPANMGKICGRGQSFHMKLYDPWRIRAPLKRTNPVKGRGVDPKWVEISWDEAFSTIASKVTPLLQDPKKFLAVTGWANPAFTGSGGSTGQYFGYAFSGVSGTATPSWISGPGGITCAAGQHNIGYVQDGTSSPPTMGPDLEYCNYLVLVGATTGINKATPSVARAFNAARARGMKLVVVDTRLSPEANKADLWIPIRGGTDQAFLLAMANVLIYELNTIDTSFLKSRTNGPYLIRSDTGLYMRSATDMLAPDPSRKNQVFGKPQVWDSVDNVAKDFDDPTVKDVALEGGPYTINGVSCKPGYQLLKEMLANCTPEWAQNITTIPAATIRSVTSDFANAAQIGQNIIIDGYTFPYRPAAIGLGRGSQTHHTASRIVEAGLLPNLLIGGMETPGFYSAGARQKPGPDGTNLPSGTASYRKVAAPNYQLMNAFWPTSYKTYYATYPAIVDPSKFGINFPLEAMFIGYTNPIFNFGSGDVTTEALAKVPFLFTASYLSDETTEMADIVLADAGTAMELQLSGDNFRQPMLATNPDNTMMMEDIYLQLAAKIGFLPKFYSQLNSALKLSQNYQLDPTVTYTWTQIIDRQLKSAYGDQYGLDWFKANGVAPNATDPNAPAKKADFAYYQNPKTRYHLYYEYLQWAKQEIQSDLTAAGLTHPYPGWENDYPALPDWHPNPSYSAPAEYDLYESNYRPFLMSMGFSPDNPWTMEAMDVFDPYTMNVQINAETGKTKGLQDGDLVWVESATQEPWARVQGAVKLSEAVHPEACIIGGEWGRWGVNMSPVAKIGPHHNSLTSSYNPDYIEQFCGNVDMGAKVRIYKVTPANSTPLPIKTYQNGTAVT